METWTDRDRIYFGMSFMRATEEQLQTIKHLSSYLPLIEMAQKELDRRAEMEG